MNQIFCTLCETLYSPDILTIIFFISLILRHRFIWLFIIFLQRSIFQLFFWNEILTFSFDEIFLIILIVVYHEIIKLHQNQRDYICYKWNDEKNKYDWSNIKNIYQNLSGIFHQISILFDICRFFIIKIFHIRLF